MLTDASKSIDVCDFDDDAYIEFLFETKSNFLDDLYRKSLQDTISQLDDVSDMILNFQKLNFAFGNFFFNLTTSSNFN